MSRVLLLDRVIGDRMPTFATAADVADFERIPYAERIAAANTYDALRLGASHAPDAPALQFLPNARADDTPVVVSHRDFVARITQAANMFHGLGIGPNDVVSVLLPLVPEAFVTIFGAQAAGIVNPVNPLLEPHQIAEILQAAKTTVLVALGPTAGTDIWAKVAKVRGQLRHLKAIVQVGGAPIEGTHDFAGLIAQQPADRLVSGRKIQATDSAAYFHTGGTTGTPKLVRLTHANQIYEAYACNLMFKSKPGAALLHGMPLFHVSGTLMQALAPLSNGGSLVVLSPTGWRNPAAFENIWPLVARFRSEILMGVPTLLSAALAAPVGNADISCFKYGNAGGSGIPIAVGTALTERNKVRVIESYGMTETSSMHTLTFIDRQMRLGSVGHAVPYSRVRVVKLDADGCYVGDCATNEIGIVAMSGPGVFSGYLDERHNAGAFVEPGWVNSGDLGRLDEDGYLWLTGRAKDVVIRGGHNIDPRPIEDVLYQHPAVALAALVGQPDAHVGELPIAYVQLKPGVSIEPGELEAWARARTPERAAVPVAVIVVDPMPVTGVGKVFKPQLRWDAAERVFRSRLAPLSETGAIVDARVGAHGTYGSFATVTVSGVQSGARAAIAQEVHQRLAPFTLRHEIVWA